jgi:ADP-heptose:LPS heptosyltransferase
LSPAQSAVLLSKCVIAISNDTGPMHLSYVVKTPVIGIFSSRDFQQKWFPPEGNMALRNYNVHCSLCFSESCSNNICMQGIPLEEVKSAFVKLESEVIG